MNTSDLIAALEYPSSSHYVSGREAARLPEHAHVFRRASGSFALRGVYLLRDESTRERPESTPAVYVAEADGATSADRIHRIVWNQNVAPFLLVNTPDGVRLYSGFRYEYVPEGSDRRQPGLIDVVSSLDAVATALGEFKARAIDDGTLWRSRSRDVDPKYRVDTKLLQNLAELGHWLQREHLPRPAAHALIGKFVYLRYLRDREILSDRRLAEWGIDLRAVFNRNASLSSFHNLVRRVDEWLNGELFPVPSRGASAPTSSHLGRVASVFLGDSAESGQAHLPFKAYDFSQIPIETLSVIYEQFLELEQRNRDEGAYYTPIPLVNFMLGEMNDRYPLRPGMRVLDPSCGSGAFLVQCYRRLVEDRIADTGRLPRPSELRDLLTRHIFGVDRDLDACRVAQLSLVLTMLDYIEPPDLQTTPTFKLPDLFDRNIFHADFFDTSSTWAKSSGTDAFDWVIGNPPWVQLASGPVREDSHVRAWVTDHGETCPITDRQAAEAFAWKALDHVKQNGVVGLLLPAMSLFKDKPAFRRAFLRTASVEAIGNFTNLREVLFAGRARLAAAAVFYRRRGRETASSQQIAFYSPLVANQEANRPDSPGTRKVTWALTLNASEVRAIPFESVSEGDHVPWKLGMWGSRRDAALLNRAESSFPSLQVFCDARGIRAHEGLQLRSAATTGEAIERVPEVERKLELNIEALRKLGRVFSFPPEAFRRVSADRAYAREGRVKTPLSVCSPPHIIVSGGRGFAVFSDDFVVVPPRQIGIAGSPEQRDLLKALSLFLVSDFATYHQFFVSPQAGVREGRSTLDALRRLPVPLESLKAADVRRWAKLHDEFVADERGRRDDLLLRGGRIRRYDSKEQQLEHDLNSWVVDLLGLSDSERYLVHDFVHVRMQLVDGQLSDRAVGAPTRDDLGRYARCLQDELDSFLAPELELRHRVTVSAYAPSGVVRVELIPAAGSARIRDQYVVVEGDERDRLRAAGKRVSAEHSQWLYFDRNFFAFVGDETFILKPLQAMWWTRTQALLDADEIIAASLSQGAVA